jgi:predicted AlkP superfamily phosphohydrolase/phosphomutase
MRKVMVVGLDGATFDVIKPLAAAGKLPNLAHIMQEGAWGPLQSAVPPITPTAWTSIFTGKNPGKYGIYDFKVFNPQTYQTRTLRINEHQEKSLWHLLGEAGKQSIILDVPFTYPPMPLEGWMLTGYGTPRLPETVFTYPANLREQLPESLRSEVSVAVPKHHFDRSKAFLEEWREVMNGRRRLLHHLMTRREWDFFFHVFTITDNLAHVFWTYLEPSHPNYHRPEAPEYRQVFFDGYQQCDALLGDMLEWAGPETTTFVISDHGFGSVYPRQYLYQRLQAGGFLRYLSPPYLSLVSDRLMKWAMHAYTRLPFLRELVKNARPQQQKAVKEALKKSNLLPSTDAIDYGRSPVLASGFGLQLWINEEGRFATGPVPTSEKADLVERIISYLLNDEDEATGRPIIGKIYRGQEIYHGAAIGSAPDVIIEYTNFYQPKTGSRQSNPNLEGGHTPEGIFLAYGPAIEAGVIQGAKLTDLAPTILYLFGEGVPPDMDGEVLGQLFPEQFLVSHPIQYGTKPARFDSIPALAGRDYTAAEEAEVEEQLRQLGYL